MLVLSSRCQERSRLFSTPKGHGLSQPSFGWPLSILDGHLKKTAFGRLFIMLSEKYIFLTLEFIIL